MGNQVWVFVEHSQQQVHSVTFEMLDEGRRIANRLRSDLVAVVFGHQLPDWGAVLGGYGADSVYVADHPILADYATDTYVAGLVALIRQRSPFVVLLAATANGRDLAPRAAARLWTGLASDCTMIKLDRDGRLEATRPTHQNKVYSTIVLDSPPPFLVTLRPGAIGMDKPDTSRRARVESVVEEIDLCASPAVPAKTTKADPSTIDISDAEIIISGGRGMGSAQNWHLVQELADELGGCVAGTRMAMDAGWIPRERLVGQTGKYVSPKLYLTLGVSGAREHMAGISEAENVVAVNHDSCAPILGAAQMAVVGDVEEVVPALIRKLRQRRQAQREKA